MSRIRPVFLGAGMILLVACTAGGNAETTTTSRPATTTSSVVASFTTSVATINQEAASYLETALDLMKEHSINTDAVDWDSVYESAFGFARDAQSPEATHPAITWALGRLEDDHSIFLGPGEAESFTDGEAVFVEPVVDTIDDRFGFVLVGRYLGDIGQQADEYALSLGETIGVVDASVCGWVVDLTTNTGGNMWPMVAGLSPLLGEGTVGSFTYPDGRVEPWRIEDGTAWWDEMPMVATTASRSEQKPVAVLIGSLTASSGEAVATAFHGGPDVVLVGELTGGLTTSNEPVELSDGALMLLTMSNFTDRNGVEFGQGISIEPDIEVAVSEAETRAIEWLAEHPNCSR